MGIDGPSQFDKLSVSRKKTEMKTRSNCASHGSVTIVNRFFGVELY